MNILKIKMYFHFCISCKSTPVSLILIILGTTIVELDATRLKNFHLYPPKITLASYTQVDSFEVNEIPESLQNSQVFENSFIAKNGSDYMLSAETLRVKFICTADYPVQWELPYPEQFAGASKMKTMTISSVRSSAFTEQMDEPKTNQFELHLKMVLNEIYTGKNVLNGYISCRPINNPLINSTIYVYAENGPSPLVGSHDTVKVNVTNTEEEVILPCRPVHPNITLSLSFKKVHHGLNAILHKDNFEWVPVPLNPPFVTFDPRRGFIFSKLKPSNLGLYNCTVDGEETIYSIIELVTGTKPSLKFKHRMVLNAPGANITFQKNNVLKCCSKTSDIWQDALTCGNGAECELVKPLFIYDHLNEKQNSGNYRDGCVTYYTATSSLVHPSLLFLCQADDLDVATQYIFTFDNENATNKLTNTDGSKVRAALLLPHRGNFHRRTNVKMFSVDESIPVENKIQFQFLTTKKDLKRLVIKNYQYLPPHYYRHVNLRGHRRRPRIGQLPLLGRFSIRMRPEMFEGERIAVVCSAIPYFYASNGWLQLHWKNGTKTIFRSENPDFELIKSEEFLRDYHGYQDVDLQILMHNLDLFVVGIIDKLDSEMKSIDCIVPVWKTEDWEKRTVKLEIEAASVPEFTGPWEEAISVKINETNVVLNCTISASEQESSVPSVLSWKKDGKSSIPISVGEVSTVSTENSTTSLLQLQIVTILTQGKYECVAVNVKGSSIKTFNVYIAAGDEIRMEIIAITVASTIAVTSLIAALLWIRTRCELQLKFKWKG